jgi:hypothetical protein
VLSTIEYSLVFSPSMHIFLKARVSLIGDVSWNQPLCIKVPWNLALVVWSLAFVTRLTSKKMVLRGDNVRCEPWERRWNSYVADNAFWFLILKFQTIACTHMSQVGMYTI